MFDKIHFNIKLDSEKEVQYLKERNNLNTCTTGNLTFYKSKETYKFEGIHIQIKELRMQIVCSLHKQYYKKMFNSLDNSGAFTMANALVALDFVFDKIGIDKARARVTYYEVGLNIPTEHDPLLYIGAIKGIKTLKGSEDEKEMFIDANFQKDRQKTTIKTRTTKKVFKIYDKGHEMQDRTRTPYIGNYILRIETMYRRQSIEVLKFFSKDYLQKIEKTFRIDWANAIFEQTIKTNKGTRESEKTKAEKLLLLGREGYLEQAKTDFERGYLTAKSFRTIREFIRDWEDIKHKFIRLPSNLETEYRTKLLKLLNYKYR